MHPRSSRMTRLAAPLCMFLMALSLWMAATPVATASGPGAQADPDMWRSMGGPWSASGDAHLLTVDALTDRTAYVVVGSSGIDTLYRTSDLGAHWAPVWQTNQPLGTLSAQGSLLYLGLASAEAGTPAILRSANGGVSWTPVYTATGATSIAWIESAAPPILRGYAAATIDGQGAALGTNDGIAWVHMLTFPGEMLRVGLDPAAPDTAFAGGQNSAVNQAQVHRTTDGGEHWRLVLAVNGEKMQDFVQVHPITSSIAFASTRPPTCCPPAAAHLWRSLDGGDHWDTVTTGYLYGLVLAPPDSIYSIFDGVSVTHDASASAPVWVNRGVPLPEWGRARAVDARPTDAALYAGLHISGVYTSTDDGVTFAPSGEGMRSLLEAHHLEPDASAEGTLYAATDQGVYRTTDGGAAWGQVLSGCLASDVALQPGNSQVLLAAIEIPADPSGPSIARSDDSGASWTIVYSHSISGRSNGGLAVAYDPDDPLRAYAIKGSRAPASLNENQVLRSTDGGAHWEPMWTAWGEVPGLNLLEATADGTVFLGGRESWEPGQAVVYRRRNWTDAWTPIFATAGGRVLTLAVAPYDVRAVQIVVQDSSHELHLWQSADQGDTWQEGALPAAGSAGVAAVEYDAQTQAQGVPSLPLVYDPHVPGRVFLGVSGPAVYESLDGGHAWAPLRGWATAQAPVVASLAVESAGESSQLYAGLGGNGLVGVWQRGARLFRAFVPVLNRGG